MTIRALPTISNKIYLSDLSESVRALEGDCLPDELAWVVVRQATESDERRVQLTGSEREIAWGQEGRTEKWNDDYLELYAVEVFSCLVGAGNIDDAHGKPLFRFENGPNYNKLAMDYESYREAYGALGSDVTTAMRLAVLTVNPQWDWSNLVAALNESKEAEQTEGEVD